MLYPFLPYAALLVGSFVCLIIVYMINRCAEVTEAWREVPECLCAQCFIYICFVANCFWLISFHLWLTSVCYGFVYAIAGDIDID